MFGNSPMMGLGFLLSMKDGITTEATRARQSLSSLERQAEKTGEALDDHVVQSQQKMAKAMKQMQIGAGMLGFGAALAVGLGAAGKQAADLEDSIRNTLTMTDLQGEAYDQMKTQMTRQAIALSGELGLAARDIGTSFYQVLSAGAKAGTEDFNALAVSALKMSKTVGLDSSQSVESLSDTLHSFGLELTKASVVADTFFMASKLGATTVPQLVEAMREAAPASREFGIELSETSATLALFAANGFKGSRAGTAFRMIITRLASPTADTKKWLDKLGISVFDADGSVRSFTTILTEMQTALNQVTDAERNAALKAIAGEEAFSKLGVVLRSDLSQLQEWTAGLENAGGALDQALADKMEGATEVGRQLLEVSRNLIITMGTPLLGIFTGLAKPLITVVRWMSDMAQKMPVFTGFVAGLTAVTAAALVLGGTFVMARAALNIYRAQMMMASAANVQMGGTAAAASGGVRMFGGSMFFAAGAARALKYALWGLTGIGAVLAVIDLLGAFSGGTDDSPDTETMSQRASYAQVPRPRADIDDALAMRPESAAETHITDYSRTTMEFTVTQRPDEDSRTFARRIFDEARGDNA